MAGYSAGFTKTSIVPTADDPVSGASVTNVDTAATTAPTISTNVFLRKIVVPSTIGSGVIWTFSPGIVVPIS